MEDISMHVQLLRTDDRISVRFKRGVLAAIACFVLIASAIPASADDSPTEAASDSSDQQDKTKPASVTRFVTPETDDRKSENPVEKSVVIKSTTKPTTKTATTTTAPPVAKSEPTPAAPPEAKPAQPTAKIKLARKPRAVAGPIITAALPYRYRYKRHGTDVPRTDVIVARPNNANLKPPKQADPPIEDPTPSPTEIAQTPSKTKEPAKTVDSPPVETQPKLPTDQVVDQPKKSPQPELMDEPAAKGTATHQIEVASFSGVQPGTTTQEELVRKWGNPTESKANGKRQSLTFSIEPFDTVRVTLSEEKVVETIAITLAKTFPSEVVARQLKLDTIEPTPVVDGGGKPLGQSFPERGVTFAYATGSGEPLVTKILLTPIRTAPFLARVGSNLEKRYEANLRDLEYVLQKEPDNGRGWWLKSRVLLSAGQPFKAIEAVKDAIRLQPDMPEYRLTRARIGGAIGKYDEAIEETKNIVLQASLTPEVKARGMALLGDLLAAKPQPDFEQAIKYHMLAIKVADPLGVHKKVRVRRDAKQVLLDAHLAVATDIASGQWKNQQTVVPQWIERADLLVEDLRANEGASEEVRLRLLRSALAACAVLDGRLDPSAWAAEADVVGQKLIAEAVDPTARGRLQWQLGTALLDGLKAEHARGQHTRAIALGTQALTLLTPKNADAYPIPERNYTVGQTYFRIGAIHAIHRKNHIEAAKWYGKAVAWLEKPLPPSLTNQLGPHGETFISMGVTFWSTGDRDRAVQLTEQGTHLLERAVKDKLLAESALSVAYSNLSSMHEKLGDRRKSKKFSEMATRVDTTKKRTRR